MSHRFISIGKVGAIVAIAVLAAMVFLKKPTQNLPIVAIANYGPHASLQACIKGVKEALHQKGFIEHQTIEYDIRDVGFDASLIPQMIKQLESKQPKVMVVLTSTVAQYAKNHTKHIPLVYSAITDPLKAGLMTMIGSSDQQDMTLVLKFAKQLLPHAKKVGLLYCTSEVNDLALLDMIRKAAAQTELAVVAIPIEEAKDVALRMPLLSMPSHRVDFIYVGTSGPIQPTLPVIAAQAKKMGIPIINVDKAAVHSGLALASFGVRYERVGAQAGDLVAQLLKGVDRATLKATYPQACDHQGLIDSQEVKRLDIVIPKELSHVNIK